MIGVPVTLTATASSPVDNTGYSIAIFDTNGNRVGGPCNSGKVCTANVASSSAAGNVYLAHVEHGNLTGIGSTSGTIAVNWVVPTISLSASTMQPAFQGGFTLTANASYPVDNSGYMMQLIDDTSDIVEVRHCSTGSTCAVTVSCPAAAANIRYQAYIDKGNPSASVATSLPLTVNCPPPPYSIALTASDLTPLVGETVTLTATTNISVSGTDDFIQIIDVTDNYSVGICTVGSSCALNPVDPGNGASRQYQACIDQGDFTTHVVCSQTITIQWDNTILF
jgi:hypothetical protein